VTWHCWAGLSALLGSLALLGPGDVATWCCWGTGGSTSSPRVGPIVGSHWGGRRRQCWPRIVVVVVGCGGGERKDGMRHNV